MATYYCVDGAAGTNDGSLANPWNDLAGVIWGTHTGTNYSALTGNDTVNIKSCNASNGNVTIDTASVTRYWGGTKGINSTTPIKWVIDDGTIWANVGTINIKINQTSAASTVYLSTDNYASWILGNNRLKFYLFGAAGNGYNVGIIGTGDPSILEDAEIRYMAADSNSTTSRGFLVATGSAYTSGIFRRCTFKQDIYSSAFSPGIIKQGGGVPLEFDSCDFQTTTNQLQSITSGSNASYGSNIRMINCSWSVRNADAPFAYQTSHNNLAIELIGCSWPLDSQVIPVANQSTTYGNTINSYCRAILPKDSEFGGAYSPLNGFVISDPKGAYPYLNAVSPNNTGWSFKCLPNFCPEYLPFNLCQMHLYYDITAAQKTITCHLAIKDTYTIQDTRSWWIEVRYTDSDNVERVESSRASASGTALSSDSDSVWSAQDVDGNVQYGAGLYDKKKISLQTAHNIKQYSDITVVVKTVEAGNGTANYFFVDPYPEVS